MVQLARWITDLQPTFSGATAYLAWNMAYNISVTCSSFADRWRWVNEGIKLIRDQAIEYNPEDPVLYKELAWIFQHKLGNIMDDANLFYKNRLAILITNVAGIKPDWEAMAAAPESERAFMKEYPEDSRAWKAARAAGFDGVQLHAAHGYLISQFLSSYYNRRSDAFGGTLENRARFLMLVLEGIRGAVDPEFPVLIMPPPNRRKSPALADSALSRALLRSGVTVLVSDAS